MTRLPMLSARQVIQALDADFEKDGQKGNHVYLWHPAPPTIGVARRTLGQGSNPVGLVGSRIPKLYSSEPLLANETAMARRRPRAFQL